jgi:ferredoxin--NADP+ reductase
VLERIDWSEGLFTLRLQSEPVSFAPGQFVNLALTIDGELVRRSYSLASAPGDPLELYLVRVEGGALTPALSELEVGDELFVDDKAQGFFTLDHVPQARDGWLVSTGTGLAPFLSMIRSGAVWQRFERIVVVHGVRLCQHLGYREELERRAAQSPDAMRYVPLVSRENTRETLSGRVTDALVDGRLEKLAGSSLDPDQVHVMLCGNPEMVKDMSALLGERGLRRHRVRQPGHVTIEKYW